MSIYSIYRITNLVNQKVYIGKTVQKPYARMAGHTHSANTGSTSLLHQAMRKHGFDNFKFEVIFVSLSKDDHDHFERHFIQEYECCVLDGRNRGYNMTRGGEGIDSENGRLENLKRVADGTHPFAGVRGKAMHGRRMTDGTHQNQTVVRTCPHCDETGVGPNMIKYHFNRCSSHPAYDRALETKSKLWSITYPDGRVVEVRNMSQFCKDNGLTNSNMAAVGKGRQAHHRGFTCSSVT